MAGMWGQVRRADANSPTNSARLHRRTSVHGMGQAAMGKSRSGAQRRLRRELYAFRLSKNLSSWPAPDSHRAGRQPNRFSCRAKHLVPRSGADDGRPFTKDLPTTWWGESVGHWDGDTLVIETTNMNGYIKVDTIGHPLSNQARLTQTFKRIDFGHMEHTFTVEQRSEDLHQTLDGHESLDDKAVRRSDHGILLRGEQRRLEYDGTIVRWKVPKRLIIICWACSLDPSLQRRGGSAEAR